MATEEHLIAIDQEDEWHHALRDMPHGYWHSWRASRALQLTHGLPTFLYFCEDPSNGHRAACVFSERKWQSSTDIFNPAGFSGFVSNGPVRDLRSNWQQFAQR